MLRAYSKDIKVSAGNAIPFSKIKFNTTRNISLEEGSNTIILRNIGFYEVNVNISFTTAEAPETQPVVIQLYANNEAIADAIIETNVTATEIVNTSFNTQLLAKRGLTGQTVTLQILVSNDVEIKNISIGIRQ